MFLKMLTRGSRMCDYTDGQIFLPCSVSAFTRHTVRPINNMTSLSVVEAIATLGVS